MKPTPRRVAGKWVVDLRGFGFGQNYPLGPDSLPEMDAMWLACSKLMELREGRPAEVPAQMALRSPKAPPRDFASALDEWERRKEYSTPGGERYGRTYAKHVRTELGGYKLSEFLPPDGADRLLAYRSGLNGAGMAPNTVANRLSIVRQVLIFAHQRLWLSALPAFPTRPRKRPPQFSWIEEAHFRAMRVKLYEGIAPAQLRRAEGVTDDVSAAIHVERRRCYFSWLFYTGVHTADADNCTGEFISLDMGVYRRRNSKSADCVPDEWFALPEPLADDLRVLQKALGRPFYGDEQIFGGPWPSVARQLTVAAKRIGLGKVNPQILRRSFAREMLKRGYTVNDVADMMGHVDTSMLRQIYARTPRPPGSGKSKWTRSPVPAQVPGAVLSFPEKASGTGPALSLVPEHAEHTERTLNSGNATVTVTKKET